MVTHKRTQNSLSAVVLLYCICLPMSVPIRAQEIETVAGRAMGTSYTLKFVNCGLNVSLEEVAKSVSEELERIESIFSLYRSDSEVSRLNSASAGEWVRVSDDLYAVATFAVELSQQTGGAFDPTLLPLIELWQGDRFSGAWKPPSQESIEAKLRTVGVSQLKFQVAPPSIQKNSELVQLDLNALVEGWAIEKVLKLLKHRGCTSALLELGGEFGTMGRKSASEEWKIGIEDPKSLSQVYATLSLNDSALCTSGSYRQARLYAGKEYSHIIDPRTGSPIDHDLMSVSVLHSNAMIADGWATALMVLGPIKGAELAAKNDIAASFVCRSGSSTSPRLSADASGKFILSGDGVDTRTRLWIFAVGSILVCGSIAKVLFARLRGSGRRSLF